MHNKPVVVITGAAGGIGEKLCEAFGKTGAQIWAIDLSLDRLKELQSALSKSGIAAHVSAVDVTDATALEKFRDTVLTEMGRIDIWLNNAGVPGVGLFKQLTPAEFSRVMRVNFDAVVLGTRLALEAMEKQKFGSIVNMGSVAGIIASPYMSSYASSKHAVVGFTRAVQGELKLTKSPVHLLLVCPGFIDTALLLNEGKPQRFPDQLRWTLGNPEKVAREIYQAVSKRKKEIHPALNGKFLLFSYRHFPKISAYVSDRLTLKYLAH